MAVCRFRPAGGEAVHPVQVGNHNWEPSGVRHLPIQGSKYPPPACGDHVDRGARDVAGYRASSMGWSVGAEPRPAGWRSVTSRKIRIPLQGEAPVMTTELCPYCRGPVSVGDSSLVCEGCGTRHHADCYAENGGCTIFGCSQAPGDEPKLSVSTPELVAVPAAATTTGPDRPLPPPPPPRPGTSASSTSAAPYPSDGLRQVGYQVVPSIFGGFGDASTAPA